MPRKIFWLSVLAGALVTGASWFVLPDRVPLHFGGSGVDQWGSRAESVGFFASLLAGLALLFWVMVVVVPRVPETLLNIPDRDKKWWMATPERRTELNGMIVCDLYAIGAATLIFFIVVQGFVIRQASETNPALGPWFWVVFSLYLVGVLSYSGYMVAVRYRAPRN